MKDYNSGIWTLAYLENWWPVAVECSLMKNTRDKKGSKTTYTCPLNDLSFSTFSGGVIPAIIDQYLTTTYIHPLNGPLSWTTQVSRYQKGKTNLDFTGARDNGWQWHQLGHMQVCTLLQTDNHASTPPLSFLQAGCPSCRPSNSVKALKALTIHISWK